MPKHNNVITMGCRLNFWESSKINSLIHNDKKNNVVVFNSCCVTNEAVKNLKKNIKSFHRLNPDVRIAVTGCAVEDIDQNLEKMQEISFVVSNKDKLSKLTWDKIQNEIEKKENSNLNFKGLYRENPSNSDVRKFIKIQNGCNHSCTFCIIPSCRGESISENVDNINKEISNNLKNGIKEVILTGVDLTSWNTVGDKYLGLGYLIEQIFKNNPSFFRLRLSSIDAAEIDLKLLDLIKNEPRLMPHFHFSLQSLDDMILKRMKRRHNVSQIIKLFDKIRNVSRNATFGADFICGFPTESDKMFSNTYALVEKLQITHLHVFPYSEKKGTPASRMPQIELKIRRARAKVLRNLGEMNYQNLLQQEVHKKHKILIETSDGIGRTENNIKVKINGEKKGRIIEAKPYKTQKNYLLVN
jgi:threonylcarbamoyladenosine tRNA methylthiotransferase MtaB